MTRLGPARRRLSRGEWKAEQAQAKFFANAKAVAKVGLKKGYKEGIEKAKAEGQEIIAQAQEQAKAIGAKVGGVASTLLTVGTSQVPRHVQRLKSSRMRLIGLLQRQRREKDEGREHKKAG